MDKDRQGRGRGRGQGQGGRNFWENRFKRKIYVAGKEGEESFEAVREKKNKLHILSGKINSWLKLYPSFVCLSRQVLGVEGGRGGKEGGVLGVGKRGGENGKMKAAKKKEKLKE